MNYSTRQIQHEIRCGWTIKAEFLNLKEISLMDEWAKNEDGTVTQLWEVYSKDGKLLVMVFSGIYHKRDLGTFGLSTQ